ncbi:hypothetical protein IQ250_04755 [Pseudanabaenaceae cyanobacterium LEGE 13415]|nr:hypothetical protein [Pseudanabaenaceae cyanobacterium LEGE 13415]
MRLFLVRIGFILVQKFGFTRTRSHFSNYAFQPICAVKIRNSGINPLE